MFKSLATLGLTLTVPLVTFADVNPNLEYLDQGALQTRDLLDILIGVVVTLALLAFFWGLAVFILNAGDEDARQRGRNIMIWGIVALFFIVAVWGLVQLVTQIFLAGDVGDEQEVPTIGGRADG